MKTFDEWKRDNSAEMDLGSVLATVMLFVIILVGCLAA
jgi:hypothetical protein